ncbi:MAG: hydrogenase nickel incorporation protein HypA/HybF [Chloroflexi bacterium]|nr:MAG: hydrogenase nickel incorporation protein HypA/HybF [Chloroflexota bacterium]
MHELSVTESLLKLTLTHAEQANAKKVTDINIVIGRLSSIVDDSVQFYWDFVAENSICEGATLHFDRRPAVLHCGDCSKEYTIDQEMTPCPACGSYCTTILSGEEFYLDSIEIEKESENEG